MLAGFVPDVQALRVLWMDQGLGPDLWKAELAKGKVDEAFLKGLDDHLIQADVGPKATTVIVDRVRQAFRDKEVTGEVEAFVKKQLRELHIRLNLPQNKS